MYCWCMPFRAMTPSYRRADSVAKKDAMFHRVIDGTPIGILGYIDDEPVAWCSIAPLETYKSSLRGRGYSSDETNNNVWSIACFFIRTGFRRQGLTSEIIDAAIDYAKDQGAKTIEAYPVDYDSPSYGFMGRIGTFRSKGFAEVGMIGIRRHMMRLHL